MNWNVKVCSTGLSLIVSASLLGSCSQSQGENQDPSQSAAPATANPTAAPNPDTAASEQPTINGVLGADVTCESPSHFAKIAWNEGLPYMTFGDKPDITTLNATPATVTINPDVSLTYGTQGESTFYTRIYPNGSCFVQVTNASGNVILEENGQATGIDS